MSEDEASLRDAAHVVIDKSTKLDLSDWSTARGMTHYLKTTFIERGVLIVILSFLSPSIFSPPGRIMYSTRSKSLPSISTSRPGFTWIGVTEVNVGRPIF